jgi:glycosyltransferase involved in cell wall biosynthesis
MSYKISFPVPTIRVEKLPELYESIDKSFTQDEWEIIFIGPHAIPAELERKSNVKYIQDWGSPSRCRQIGLIHSEGDWMCYAADDVLFFPGALDRAYDKIKVADYKTAILGKYTEGNRENPLMLTDDYYRMDFHDAFKEVQRHLSKTYYLFQSGLVSSKMIKEIGGWDCQFQTCAMACVDLSMRLQNNGVEIIMTDEPLFHASHMEGTTGDHAPIHYAQTLYDEPLFKLMYSCPAGAQRVKIGLDNWQDAPSKWEKRFGK